jgi:hypothetical protein
VQINLFFIILLIKWVNKLLKPTRGEGVVYERVSFFGITKGVSRLPVKAAAKSKV